MPRQKGIGNPHTSPLGPCLCLKGGANLRDHGTFLWGAGGGQEMWQLSPAGFTWVKGFSAQSQGVSKMGGTPEDLGCGASFLSLSSLSSPSVEVGVSFLGWAPALAARHSPLLPPTPGSGLGWTHTLPSSAPARGLAGGAPRRSLVSNWAAVSCCG